MICHLSSRISFWAWMFRIAEGTLSRPGGIWQCHRQLCGRCAVVRPVERTWNRMKRVVFDMFWLMVWTVVLTVLVVMVFGQLQRLFRLNIIESFMRSWLRVSDQPTALAVWGGCTSCLIHDSWVYWNREPVQKNTGPTHEGTNLRIFCLMTDLTPKDLTNWRGCFTWINPFLEHGASRLVETHHFAVSMVQLHFGGVVVKLMDI